MAGHLELRVMGDGTEARAPADGGLVQKSRYRGHLFKVGARYRYRLRFRYRYSCSCS